MKANEIRYLLQKHYINTKNDNSIHIWKELQICNGRSFVDLAVLSNSLNAFEIKSDCDTLSRLPRQIESYNRVFDYIIIVTGEAHLKKVKNIVPAFWGIWTLTVVDGKITRNVIRKEDKNTEKDAFSIAQLLWKEEILDLLKRHTLHKGMSTKRKWLLWEFLANNFSISELTEEVKYYLTKRENWKIMDK